MELYTSVLWSEETRARVDALLGQREANSELYETEPFIRDRKEWSTAKSCASP